MKDWYQVDNIDEVDSPGLLIYPDRVKENIRIAKSFLDDPNRLRPHIKTNKSPEVTKMFVEAGITKFKCATIAEAEMLAMNGAKDVLLAHQPVGPKGKRLKELIRKYPSVKFSCIFDDATVARTLDGIDLYIDLNVGMNRTGIDPEKALPLYNEFQSQIVGLHAYDGHLRDPDISVRKKQSDEGFARVLALRSQIKDHKSLTIIAGGTPSFSIHSKRKDVECSPGTFIYWDKGYQSMLAEQPFLIAALVVTRVISLPTDDTICIDLGHKGIASENPIDKRVYFLNAEGLTPIGHSEEHMVLRTTQKFKIGDVLYGVPHHICPTVNLYDSPNVIENGKYVGNWETVSRKRKITV